MVGKEWIRIATSHNVQLIALLACEHFGITLPICDTTRRKIEQTVKAQIGPTRLRMFKATVGYAGNDSMMQLSKTRHGVNFLALAATLVSTTNIYESSLSLEKIMMGSAEDKTVVPSGEHLRDLRDVLEPRLNRTGFLTEVLGWKHVIEKPTRSLTERQRNAQLRLLSFPRRDREDSFFLAGSFPNWRCLRIGHHSWIVRPMAGCSREVVSGTSTRDIDEREYRPLTTAGLRRDCHICRR